MAAPAGAEERAGGKRAARLADTLAKSVADAGFGLGALLILAVFAAILVLSLDGTFHHSDDAYILYSYAVNLAETGVVSYYPGGPPTEGATDFLFMTILAALAWAGLPAEAASVAVSAIAAVIAFGAVYALARDALDEHGLWRTLLGPAVAALLLGAHYLVAAMLGFGVFVFLAPFSLMLLFFLRGNVPGFHLAALATCLARPDGFVFAAPLCAAVLWRERRSARSWVVFAVALLLPGLAYFAWRWSYFGLFLPLPFYVKTAAEPDLLGLFYRESLVANLRALIQVPLFVLGIAVVFLDPRRILPYLRENAILIAVFVLGFLFYAAVVQEQNAGYRFQAPLHLILLVLLLRLPVAAPARIRLTAVAALVAAAMIASSFNTGAFVSNDDNVVALAEELGDLPRGTMLVTEAGRLPFESRWIAVDSWGLNTPEFATRVITPEDVRALRPDLIVVHSFEDVRRIELRAFHPGDRKDWHVQARNVLIGAGFDYELFYVPFSFADPSPDQARKQRYDLYLVRQDSPLAAPLRSLLQRFGGVGTEELMRRLRISVG